MKKILRTTAIIIFFEMLCCYSNAQSLAINTTGDAANSSALLDVSSLSKGMLVPRVDLISINDVATIVTPAVSLLVYNTNATIIGGSGTGYYYFTGAKWLRITDDSNYVPGWALQGNAGTVSGTNFVGTTDAVDLMFVTNNFPRMTISAAGNTAINASPTGNDYLYVYGGSKGPGLTNIYAFNPVSAPGTTWDAAGVAAMIKGYSFWGDSCSAALAGYSYHDFAGSAAVIGARHDGGGAGFLGYFNGITSYGVYTPVGVPGRIGGDLEIYGALTPGGSAGTAGQVLTSGGVGIPPTWTAPGGGGSGWLLTGNGGTAAGTNFVGTTDPVDLVFKTNGAENMRIRNASGNIGINQAVPLEKLHINGNTRFQGDSYITNGNSHVAFNTTNTFAYRLGGVNASNQLDYGDHLAVNSTVFRLPTGFGMNFQDAALNSSLYIQTSTGNIGINQTLPLEKLHINGSTRFQGHTYITNGNSHAAFNTTNTFAYRLGGVNASNQLDFGDHLAVNSTVFRLPTGFAMNFQDAALNSRLYIQTATGNIGINQTLPLEKLHINGSTRFQGHTYITNGNSHAAFNTTNTFAYRLGGVNAANQLDFGDHLAVNSTVFRLPTGFAMNFQDAALNSRLYIETSTGNVGINQTIPLEKLHINGSTRFQGHTYITNGNSHAAFNTTNTFAYRLGGMNASNQLDYGEYVTPNSTVFRLPTGFGMNFQDAGLVSKFYIQTNTGYVGIGNAAPSHQLELSTDDAAKPGTNTWTIISDIRMKQNIHPYKDGLTKLLQVEPIEYNYNERSGYDTKPVYVGVSAQELQKIAPYMVGTFKKNGEEFLDINTSAMMYMMVNAIKEQQKMIDVLKKEIEALKRN